MATVEMKHLIFAVCVMFWTCVSPTMSQEHDESSVAKIHEQWMSQYGRSYPDNAEKEKRLKIFMENLEFIENFSSAQNKSYKLGLNQFADFTTEEFIASHTGLEISNQNLFSSKVASVASLNWSDNIPWSIDWREQGAVTYVKNQRHCDCCWAFSVVAAIEGFIKIKTGYLISLSEQQLVDCTVGCRGSFMEVVYNYIMQNGGIASEINYPYQAYPYTCRQNEVRLSAQISGFANVNNEEQLLQALVYQPVSCCISISRYFIFYKGGIFTGPCGTDLNHAVTAIGYGTSESGYKYWLIKNSWDSDWGEGGYMRLLRESGQPEGLCGIAIRSSYPT